MINDTTKSCARCKQDKPLSNFYKRSGIDNPIIAGHYVSECKTCMKERAKNSTPLDYTEPRWHSEQIAIDYLKSKGIPALPGKSLRIADVDIVAWGHVHIEVKYARVERGNKFKFVTTPKQQKRGLLAHIVLLICEYDTHLTYHLFKADNPVFYIDGRIKTGFDYVVGTERATKHRLTRVVMTDGMMQRAQDRLGLITDTMATISKELMEG